MTIADRAAAASIISESVYVSCVSQCYSRLVAPCVFLLCLILSTLLYSIRLYYSIGLHYSIWLHNSIEMHYSIRLYYFVGMH